MSLFSSNELTTGNVGVFGRLAGTLTMVATDEYHFVYDSEYLASENPTPISLAMPLREEPYIDEALHPLFDNLLFESHQLRLAEGRYHLDGWVSVDRFRLLLLTGSQTLSHVTIEPADRKVNALVEQKSTGFSKTLLRTLENPYPNHCPVCLKPNLGVHDACQRELWNTTKEVQIEVFEEDPMNTFRTFHSGYSVSGAQRKVVFSRQGGSLKLRGPVSHMVKPDGTFPEMPANEHIVMATARQLGFLCPPCALYRVEGVGLVYIIRRFDQVKPGIKHAVEDFAQLSLEPTSTKDQSTMEHVAHIIETFASAPKVEFVDFWRRLLFCFLVGNGDMHLKNWSMLLDRRNGLVKLAPIYDFLSTRTSFRQEQVESILSLCSKQVNLNRDDFSSYAKNTLKLSDRIMDKTFGELPIWRDQLVSNIEISALLDKRKEIFLSLVDERFKLLSI